MLATNLSSGGETAATDELVNRLQEQLACRFRGLRVQVRGTGLVLAGHVPTYYAKQVAQQLVMQATDVPIVANDIEVR